MKVLSNLDYIDVAHDRYHEMGTLEIDSCAAVSKRRKGGAYVQAWVWINTQEVRAWLKEQKERRGTKGGQH